MSKSTATTTEPTTTVSSADTTPETKRKDIARALKADASFYVQDVLKAPTYDKQDEILQSVTHHRRISVSGCNSSGKDYTMGRLLIWWMETRENAEAVVYGPTHRQVADVVFKEARRALEEAPTTQGFELRGHMLPRAPRYVISPTSFAFGFASNDEFNLQGFHGPNSLVIITEAHAVNQAYVDALIRLTPHTIIMTGNPLVSSGPFYDTFHEKRDRWHCINISAWDTPNLRTDEYTHVPGMIDAYAIEEMASEWGEESPLYVAAVDGRFPDNIEDAIVPLSLATEASNRHIEHSSGQVILALDVAREGDDKTVLVRRQGNQADILWKGHERNLMRVVALASRACTAEAVDLLVVDDTGLGGGVTDRLKELRHEMAREAKQLEEEGSELEYGHSLRDTYIHPFKAGGRASTPKLEKHFVNTTAECWWAVRKWLQDGGCIPKDQALIAQLTSRRYAFQSDQRIQLESKKDLKKKGRKSPDEADALTMTFSGKREAPKVW